MVYVCTHTSQTRKPAVTRWDVCKHTKLLKLPEQKLDIKLGLSVASILTNSLPLRMLVIRLGCVVIDPSEYSHVQLTHC